MQPLLNWNGSPFHYAPIAQITIIPKVPGVVVVDVVDDEVEMRADMPTKSAKKATKHKMLESRITGSLILLMF